ncbi:MAG: transcription elongation factor GreA [Chloroflexota bacterium]|nr:transcription elongation factor GreA [Chloroflexota bacterium]
MQDVTYLTLEGKEALQKELDNLVNVVRPDLAVKLAEAVSQGDLKENADYHDAKEKQAFLEGRIQQIEKMLRSAVIIDKESNAAGVIGIGSQVTIIEEGYDEEESYTIVGMAEANPAANKISNESPVGSALLGHKKGDKVTVKTPMGQTVFKIKSVK